MRMYILTDMEGVAGVMNVDDWLVPGGRRHEAGKRLLTLEVNAAVAAFADSGFSHILVNDSHGLGGVDGDRLDERALLLRGWQLRRGRTWPAGLDASYDAMAVVGQHAKAGTPAGHIPHTQWWDHLDFCVNGVSMGEYGQFAMVGGEHKVPVIFASGDKALCAEVHALTPWVVTAPVKTGTCQDAGDELSAEQYEHSHEGATHLRPGKARRLIQRQAHLAARAFSQDRSAFKPLTFDPPIRMTCTLRPHGDKPARRYDVEHPSSVSAALIALWRKFM